MKTDVAAFKKQVDSLVFGNEAVKALVEKGFVCPESIIKEYECPVGVKKTRIEWHYTCCLSEHDDFAYAVNGVGDRIDDMYLFGWNPEEAVEKVAEFVIKTLTWRADPSNKKAIEQAEYDFYSAYYDGNHYNGD